MATTISSGTNPYKLGSPPDFGTLYSGRALEFDGVTDYVDMTVPALSDTFTVSAWAKWDAGSTGSNDYDYIISFGAETALQHFSMSRWSTSGSNDNKFYVYDSSAVFFGTNALPIGSWVHIVAVAQPSSAGDILTLYVNGVSESIDQPSGDFAISSSTGSIGRLKYSNEHYMKGKISNVQIWDKAWSLSDVQYAYTHPEKLITDNSAVTSGTTISNLKAWYPCTEGNPRSPQTTIYDGSPKGLGSEEVTNNSFDDGETGYVEISSGFNYWALSGGTATFSHTGSASFLTSTDVYTSGSLYKTVMDIASISNCDIRILNNGNVDMIPEVDTAGIHTYYAVADRTGFAQVQTTNISGTGACVLNSISVKEVKMGNHGTTKFYGTEIFTQTDAQWDSTGAFISWIYYDDGTNSGAGTLKQDGWTLYAGRKYEFKMVLGTGNNMGIAIKSYDGAVTHVAEATYPNVTTHIITFTPASDKDGIMIDVDGSVAGACNLTTGSWSLKEVGVAGGWTTADAEPLIPQTALMGMSKPILFDGIDDYVTIEKGVHTPTGGAVTLSAWIKTDSTPGSYHKILSLTQDYSGDTQSGGLGVINGGGINCIIYDGAYRTAAYSTNINDGKWHHLVGTIKEGGSMILYYDGVSVATYSTLSTLSGTPIYTTIGAMRKGASTFENFTYVHGVINECSVWSNEFTLAEVQELFNDGVALDATAHSQSDNLVGYWRNDGASTWTDRANKGVASFDGTSTGHIQFASRTTYDVDGGTYSFCFWHKSNDTSVQHRVISDTTSSYKFINIHSNGSIYIETNTNEDSASAVLDNHDKEWRHYAVVTNGDGSVTMYQDGVDLNATGTIEDDLDVIRIGGAGSSNRVNGQVAGVHFFDIALSGSEVTELYAIDKRSSISGHSQFSNCVGSWLMGAGSGDTASTIQDQTSENNDATVIGASLVGYNDGTVSGSPDTILLPEGTTSGKDILGFPLTVPNNGWLNITDGEPNNKSLVVIPNSSVFDFTSGSFTVSFWLKPLWTKVGYNFIISKGGYLVHDGWEFRTQEDNIYQPEFTVWEDDGTRRRAKGGTLVYNEWVYLVGIYDISVPATYLYKVTGADTITTLATNTAVSGNISTNTRNIIIGSGSGTGWQATLGKQQFSIDEVKIYNRALEQEEITKNYKHGKSKHKN